MLDQINIQYYSIPETVDIEISNDSINTFAVLHESDWNDQTKELLTKMLKAVKLDENNFQIIPKSPSDTIALSSIFSKSPQCKILVFGLTPTELQLNCQLSLYTKTTLEQTTLLFSDSLATLMQKPQLKKPLWTALQSMYA